MSAPVFVSSPRCRLKTVLFVILRTPCWLPFGNDGRVSSKRRAYAKAYFGDILHNWYTPQRDKNNLSKANKQSNLMKQECAKNRKV